MFRRRLGNRSANQRRNELGSIHAAKPRGTTTMVMRVTKVVEPHGIHLTIRRSFDEYVKRWSTYPWRGPSGDTI